MAELLPRPLSERERALLWWVLPEQRPAYAAVRQAIEQAVVVAIGRRGDGNLILAPDGHRADIESPLPSVMAFGEMRTAAGRGSVTVREAMFGQVEVELVEPLDAAGSTRWTYSTWTPGEACPSCGTRAREVRMATRSGNAVTLAICPADRRVWVHEERSGLCRPIPVTLYYSELMRRTGVRDPKIALHSEKLFEASGSFSDEDLTLAFISYNHVRSKVDEADPIQMPAPRQSWLRRWFPFSRT